MPKNALEDLTVCLHYSEDWERDDDWDDIYDNPKVEADTSMESLRVKHGILKDGYNRRWLAIVNSFQAIAPLTGQKKGVHFLREHISLKNGTFCPLFSHDTGSFKDTCLLIK
jgi:hypothetical protein